MINYKLKDNNIDQYIAIEPKQPIFGYLPKEESTSVRLTEWNYNGSIPGSEQAYASSNYKDLVNFLNAAPDVKYPIPNSGISATDYIGVQKMLIPYIINSNFCDIKFLNLLQHKLPDIGSGIIEAFTEDFYESNDSNRLITLFNGLQYLRLPAAKFQDNNGENLYSKYYIKVTPKYIDLPITSIQERTQESNNDIITNGTPSILSGITNTRRRLYKVNSSNLNSTPWQFESNNSQTGRFWGSVCEIWDSSLIVKKSTKVVVDCSLTLTTDSSLSISPDLVGFDNSISTPVTGDIIRVFPRETYFEPIFIEVNFDQTDVNFAKAIAYLTNDVVRDLTTSIVEVYDDKGITIDSSGSINGTILDSYEISKLNDKEIRRKINFNTQSTQE